MKESSNDKFVSLLPVLTGNAIALFLALSLLKHSKGEAVFVGHLGLLCFMVSIIVLIIGPIFSIKHAIKKGHFLIGTFGLLFNITPLFVYYFLSKIIFHIMEFESF